MVSSTKWLLLMLVALPYLLAVTSRNGGSFVVMASEEDAVEDEDAAVDEEDSAVDDDSDEEGLGRKKNVHKDADTFLLFTQPAAYPDDAILGLPAGQKTEFLVGFRNNGEQDFMLASVDASLRYPMDYSIHLQNFSAVRYNRVVKSGQEATVSYSFIPADAFAGRPIGLTINLNYEAPDGSVFIDPVFNRTVQITEYHDGFFDSEVLFMYIFLSFGAFLLLFLVYTFAMPRSKGKKTVHKPVETGTANDDVDYEWIPKSALQTPGGTKTSTSPRRRRGANKHGSDTE